MIEQAESWSWRVIAAPEGSTSQPKPSVIAPNDSAVSFMLDVVGEYQLELSVEQTDCEPVTQTFRVSATPGDGVYIELVWDTPADPDQTDLAGTDMDLHFLAPEPRARWNIAPFDCYYGNVNPDWGVVGDEGNPGFDIDDTNGAGPEAIRLLNPVDTRELERIYQVGVHYYRAENSLTFVDMGPSEAHIRIYIDGLLRGEFTQVMEMTHYFWVAAGISYENGMYHVLSYEGPDGPTKYYPDFP